MSELKLSNMKPGEKGRVLFINGGGIFLRRLVDMGVVKGVDLTLVRRAPLGDPVEVEVRGYNLTLRKAEAENITVEVRG
ncbi:FeoA family protein [Candidatus Pyrohabitans sp.]